MLAYNGVRYQTTKGVYIMTAQKATESNSVTVVQASQAARVTQVYIRQLIAKGKIAASKNNQGRVRIDKASLAVYCEFRKAKEAKKQNAIDHPESTRPSIASCDRIAKRVSLDKKLTPEQRALFTAAIERYRTAYNVDYAERGKDE